MRKIYSSAVWSVSTKEKKIFLTFDDGPVPDITPWVLSQLKQYHAKATFFCVGANIEKYPQIFHQIIAEGHSIGNHTYDHLNGWKTKTKEYLDNIEKCENSLRLATNRKQETENFKLLFRPPYGKIRQSHISHLKSQYSFIMWDVLSGDFDQTISEEKCLRNVLTKTRQGSIVVFHDSIKAKKNLCYVLPKFLEYFSKKGFVFSRLVSSGCSERSPSDRSDK